MQRRKRRATPRGPGYTISQFAVAVNQTSTVIRNAVNRGEIAAILFNNIKRIPPREKDRYLAIWGTDSIADGTTTRATPAAGDPAT